MTSDWLHRYLTDAVDRKLCTKVFCSTCGATEFLRGVLPEFEINSAKHPDAEATREIARALAGVVPTRTERTTLEPAVRCLLYRLYERLQIQGHSLEAILEGSWAGQIFIGMKAHDAAQRDAWRAHEELQKNLKARKLERRRLKQEQHQARVEQKKERDRIWREKSHGTEKD